MVNKYFGLFMEAEQSEAYWLPVIIQSCTSRTLLTRLVIHHRDSRRKNLLILSKCSQNFRFFLFAFFQKKKKRDLTIGTKIAAISDKWLPFCRLRVPIDLHLGLPWPRCGATYIWYSGAQFGSVREQGHVDDQENLFVVHLCW